MNKEIKFLMKFDTSEFDRAIEKMQRQLKEVYRPADMVGAQRKTAERLDGMGVGGGAKPGAEAYFKSIQNTRREMDTLLQKYSKDQQNLIKDLAAHEQHQKRLKKAQDDAIKGSQEELRIARELKLVEEQTYRMRESWMARNQALNQAIDARQNLGPKDKMERLMTAFQGGGMKGGMAEGGQMAGDWWKGLGMTGQAGTIIAGLIAASKGVGKIGDMATAYHGLPLQVAAAQGSATQNTYGREIQAIYGGNQGQEMAFMPEKQKAAGMAGEHIDSQKFWDKISTGQFSFDMARKLAVMSPRAGALMAAVGTAQAAVAATGLLGDRRQQAALGMVSGRNQEMYQSMQSEEYAANYAKAVQDLKAQNPLKTAATEQFNQRYMSDLQFQRQTGLNYQGFSGAGGLRETAINAGFTGDMGMEAAQGIMAGGGSTRGGQGLGVLSMQAQRNNDLTNAGGIIGKLSGQMGDNESTRQAFVRMLAESTKIGLDSSQFREENRRFLDAAGSIIEKSGTTSQSDISALMQMFGGFVGTPTVKGMESAQTAFQTYVSGTSQTQGPQGAMRAAAMMRDPSLGTIAGPDMAALAGIDMEHLTTDHPVVKDIADRYFKGDTTKVVNLAKKAGQSSFHRLKKGDDLQSKLTDLRDSMAKAPGGGAGDYIRQNLQKQIDSTQNEYSTTLGIEYPALLNDPQALKRLAEGTSQPGGKGMSQEEIDKVTKGLGVKDTGRPEDQAVQAAAEGSRVMLQAFQQFHDVIVPSADAVKTFNTNLKAVVDTMMSMKPGERAKFMADHPILQTLFPKTQSQSGKEQQ